jgi:hypothetical protein
MIHGSRYNYDKVNYIKSTLPVTITCNRHGDFEQQPTVHNSGSGCPRCWWKTQIACVEFIEKLTNKKFLINTYPKFLEGLEYDGYNEELKLAIEYNGEQHYKYHPFFHRNGEEDLIKQQERDSRKVELSKKNNIYLIIVPYYTEDIEGLISKEYSKFLAGKVAEIPN